MGNRAPNESSDAAQSLARAAVLAQAGRLAQALATLAAHTYPPPLDLAADLLQAQLLAASDVERCWAMYTRALARYPDHAVLNLRAGVFAYERGDREQARVLLTHSWFAAPMPETGYYLGKIHAGDGKVEPALAYFVQAVAFERPQGYWRKLTESELAPLLALDEE